MGAKGGKMPAPAALPAPPPPPPPAPDAPPKAPVIDAEARGTKSTQQQKKAGTNSLRIDMNLGAASNPGLNIPV